MSKEATVHYIIQKSCYFYLFFAFEFHHMHGLRSSLSDFMLAMAMYNNYFATLIYLIVGTGGGG